MAKKAALKKKRKTPLLSRRLFRLAVWLERKLPSPKEEEHPSGSFPIQHAASEAPACNDGWLTVAEAWRRLTGWHEKVGGWQAAPWQASHPSPILEGVKEERHCPGREMNIPVTWLVSSFSCNNPSLPPGSEGKGKESQRLRRQATTTGI